ncbi:hypothetical protein [Actinacidiphila yeochonensis]|uniref:hypothetical protein n=1 Tax=Actinacidiphila yeochonensis TaxID=89050 RepID=UPI0005686D85|nr:hypothetical protein [Actinacidiphila yeochonensis]
MPARPLVLPPVRLLSPDELARHALAAPLLHRALRLVRWAGEERPVDGFGDLPEDELAAAAAELGLDGEEGLDETAYAWAVAAETALLALEIPEEAREASPAGVPVGRAVPGEAYRRLDGAALAVAEPADGGAVDPHEVLDLWLETAESALADATLPGGPLAAGEDDALSGVSEGVAEAEDELYDDDAALDEAEENGELLDAAMVNLYAFTALGGGSWGADGGTEQGAASEEDAAPEEVPDGGGAPVPLPVLAASLVAPEDAGQPSEEMLDEVTEVIFRLDGLFHLLASTGLLEYQPLDEALIEEVDGEGDEQAPGWDAAAASAAGADDLTADELARYGTVRLTPLGLYGLRERMLEAGAHVPVLGDLADAPAADLLDALPGYPAPALRAEAGGWVEGREPVAAARELLAASVGADPEGPGRRLACRTVLDLLGPAAEPAVREVLDEPELAGLAWTWLRRFGAADLPAPSPEAARWLAVDVLAACLHADEDPEDLAEVVVETVAADDGFAEDAWRVGHPATAVVLEAVGRLHPDRGVAKQARKAAFKARSRQSAAG